jgi:hypothetical protein
MTMGGLPQFCCFTTANTTSVQLDMEPVSDELEPHGGHTTLHQYPVAVTSFKELDNQCGELLNSDENLSVPLIVNLLLIRSAIAGELGEGARDNFRRFLRDAFPSLA